jgi:hypothetical protein
MGYGLLRYDLQTGEVKAYTMQEDAITNRQANSIVNNYISQLALSPDGRRVYAATTMGICALDIKTESWLSTFGINTPDALLVKLYALGACVLMYYALKRAGYKKRGAAALAFLICFSSSLLPLTLDGAVWYHAQVLAFFLTMAAVCLFTMDFPTPALLCYALSVACRPFNALYGLPLFFTWFSLSRRAGVSWKSASKPLIPGVCLGLLVAFGMGLYNYARFGNPLEFGHNYLPEFSFQGGVQFVAHGGVCLGEVGHAVHHGLGGLDDLFLVTGLLIIGPGDADHAEERH